MVQTQLVIVRCPLYHVPEYSRHHGMCRGCLQVFNAIKLQCSAISCSKCCSAVSTDGSLPSELFFFQIKYRECAHGNRSTVYQVILVQCLQSTISKIIIYYIFSKFWMQCVTRTPVNAIYTNTALCDAIFTLGQHNTSNDHKTLGL